MFDQLGAPLTDMGAMDARRERIPPARRRPAHPAAAPPRALRSAAAAERELLRALLAGVGEGVLAFGADGRRTRGNPTAERLLGPVRHRRDLPGGLADGTAVNH